MKTIGVNGTIIENRKFQVQNELIIENFDIIIDNIRDIFIYNIATKKRINAKIKFKKIKYKDKDILSMLEKDGDTRQAFVNKILSMMEVDNDLIRFVIRENSSKELENILPLKITKHKSC